MVLALQDSLAALKRWRSRGGGTPCWHRVGGDWWCLGELMAHPAVLLVSAVLLLGAGTSSHCWDTELCSGPAHQGLTVPDGRSLPQPFLCTAHPVFRFQATYLSNL